MAVGVLNNNYYKMGIPREIFHEWMGCTTATICGWRLRVNIGVPNLMLSKRPRKRLWHPDGLDVSDGYFGLSGREYQKISLFIIMWLFQIDMDTLETLLYIHHVLNRDINHWTESMGDIGYQQINTYKKLYEHIQTHSTTVNIVQDKWWWWWWVRMRIEMVWMRMMLLLPLLLLLMMMMMMMWWVFCA